MSLTTAMSPTHTVPRTPKDENSSSIVTRRDVDSVVPSAGVTRTQAPSACQNPNRVTVQFDRFDVAAQTVVADIAAVLAGANVDVNAPNTSPGCMSFLNDADCPPVMGALGLSYGGVAAPGPQRLFSVR